MTDGAARRTVGTVVGYRIEGDELILSIALADSVGPEDVGRDARIGDFRYGSPLGTKIEPRFEGRRDCGLIDVSVLDREVAWTPGVFESNGPRFVGEMLTVLR